ncbi:sensor histidine kinase [Actinobaculum suis]|uniref:sensor histidine kinase n=1 Tax=Actinobaculum suis TaxID=1657 RepID=UPI00066FBBF3|nr:HAMP domain-containing sensor histidine kinase [Actinobaculum suis]KMY23845.1 histidine kinase [Actinobaculum suis]OCA93490.1 two-component sensor histidine kinase [Actinobaculum suis]OCA95226.1 two-component sensor histidine kinase [Actinobaculum suis]
MRLRAVLLCVTVAGVAGACTGIPLLLLLDHYSRTGWDRPTAVIGLAIGIFLVSLVVGGLFGVVVARRESRKLSAHLIYLAAAAEQLGAGQTRPRMKPSRIEEIDLVYQEIQRAADRFAGRLSAERQFSADASHQLRTPLASLSMRLEEIQYLSDDAAVSQEATQCLEQIERLTQVIDDLLARSRQESAGTEAVALEPVFAQQKAEWEQAFAAAGREVEFVAASHGPVLASPSGLSQIIATLVENSLKYGAGTTTVSSKNVGQGAVISVADEGEGVAPEIAEAVFTKGFSTGGSTGIGLPLARDMAESFGGRLELTQKQPPIFTLSLRALPEELDPRRVMPSGGVISVGARRRRY